MSGVMNKRRAQGFSPDFDAAREKRNQVPSRPDQPFFKKIRAENALTENAKRQKYTEKDFQRVLKRMLKENKSLQDVCEHKDLPSYQTVRYYAGKNKEFRKALERTYKQLPYSIQAMAGRLPKAKFQKEIVRLRKSGLSMAEISRRLGLSESSVLRRLQYL